MPSESPGRTLMTAGVIVFVIGLGIIVVRELHIPRYWIPVIVGAALFLAGVVRRLTAKRPQS